MLVISLFLSSLLLLAVNLIVRRVKDWPLGPVLACCAAGAPCFLAFVLPAVLLQAILLLVLTALAPRLRWRPRSFLALSGGATVLAYAVAGYFGSLGNSYLRARFPYESMEGRLPTPKPISHTTPAARTGADYLRNLELFEYHVEEEARSVRRRDLERLHEHALELFISSPGFGVTRMPRPTEWRLTRELRPGEAVAQPSSARPAEWSPGLAADPHQVHQDDLGNLHRSSVLDFVNPPGFGFVKDREHVAGFQSHQFSQVPEPTETWKVDRLELVGLVLHDEPVAYVSESLPKMDDLRETATRKPDTFEAFGLSALLRGDQLFIGTVPGALRMLGAVRNVKGCIDCHGGERGDLLGAFSYTLRPRS